MAWKRSSIRACQDASRRSSKRDYLPLEIQVSGTLLRALADTEVIHVAVIF